MVNVEKSKILKFSKGGRKRNKVSSRWEGKTIEEVKKYKYLRYVSKKWRTGSGKGKGQERSSGNGAGMGNKEKEIWRRLREWIWLFDALVWTVIRYGAEVWA